MPGLCGLGIRFRDLHRRLDVVEILPGSEALGQQLTGPFVCGPGRGERGAGLPSRERQFGRVDERQGLSRLHLVTDIRLHPVKTAADLSDDARRLHRYHVAG